MGCLSSASRLRVWGDTRSASRGEAMLCSPVGEGNFNFKGNYNVDCIHFWLNHPSYDLDITLPEDIQNFYVENTNRDNKTSKLKIKPCMDTAVHVNR